MEKSSFFNAVLDQAGNPDRSYLAEDFARYFSSFIGNGVFPNPSNNVQVIANNNMSVTINQGKAWIDGYFYFNTDNLIIKIDPADGVLSRIDRVVLKLDFLNREIKVKVKKGSFASSPVAPTVTRDADAYEIALGDIRINKGAISITQDDITDIRQNKELCGIVHGTVDQVDVTTLFNQYATKLGLKQIEFEQDFKKWFDTIRDLLNENVAGNLANKIADLEKSVQDLFTNASNGKQNWVDVIGSPLSVTDTFSTLKSKTQNLKNTLASNLTAKEKPSNGTETLQSLVNKVGDIEGFILKAGDVVTNKPVGSSTIFYNDDIWKEYVYTTMKKEGTIRIVFQLISARYLVYGRVYINGVPKGIERSTSMGYTGELFTEDFKVTKGDRVSMYGKVEKGNTGYLTLKCIGIAVDITSEINVISS